MSAPAHIVMRRAAENRTYKQRLIFVDVVCPGCGSTRTLGERQARRIASGVHTGLCEPCRESVPVTATASATDLHEFWRSNFSQAQIDSMWRGVSLYLDLTPRKAEPIEDFRPEALPDRLQRQGA